TWTNRVEDAAYEPNRVLVRQIGEAIPEAVGTIEGPIRTGLAHVANAKANGAQAQSLRLLLGDHHRAGGDVDPRDAVAAARQRSRVASEAARKVEQMRRRCDGQVADEEVHLLIGCRARDRRSPKIERERREKRLKPFR